MVPEPGIAPSARALIAQVRTYFPALPVELMKHETAPLVIKRSAISNELVLRRWRKRSTYRGGLRQLRIQCAAGHE